MNLFFISFKCLVPMEMVVITYISTIFLLLPCVTLVALPTIFPQTSLNIVKSTLINPFSYYFAYCTFSVINITIALTPVEINVNPSPIPAYIYEMF